MENLQLTKLSTLQIMDLIEQAQDGLINLSDEELKFLGVKLREKPDNFKSFFDLAQMHVDMLKTKENEIKEKRQAIEKTIERAKDFLIKMMQEFKYEKLSGTFYEISLRETKKIETLVEPTPELFARMPPGLIKRSYSWDKLECKNYLKGSDAEDLKDLVKQEKNYHLSIKVKGLNNGRDTKRIEE
jgi:hypothetical protein